MSNKIIIRDAIVQFYNPPVEGSDKTKKGFNPTITINATPYKKEIEKWADENKLKIKFKEYTPEGGDAMDQFAFKFNRGTKFAYLSGSTEEQLGYGATIDLVASAYEYSNTYGKGISHALSAVVVKKGRSTSGDADLAELLAGQEEVPATAPSTEPESAEDAKAETQLPF